MNARRPLPRAGDHDAWVRRLGLSHARQGAKHHLRAVGAPAVPAIRRGLRHPDPEVRRACVSLLDALLDADAVPDLVGALDDDDGQVVKRALHALACDQCKQNGCTPGDELFVGRALDLVRSHPDPDVRAGAIDALGKAVERNPAVGGLLAEAAAGERHPGLRDMVRSRLGG